MKGNVLKNANRLLRFLLIALFLLLVIASTAWWIFRTSKPSLAIAPIGRILQPDGTFKFVVAITNNSRSTFHCVAGRTQIFTQGDGKQTTNFMEMNGGWLASSVGAHFAFDISTNPPPWTLSVAYKPMLSQTALKFHAMAARWHLSPFAADYQFAESIEISR